MDFYANYPNEHKLKHAQKALRTI